MASGSFFVPQGGAFVATELTRGPWDERLMHGGPPSALLGRALERLAGPDAAIARMTVEFVRPLAIGEVTISAELVRPGRKLRILKASLSSGGVEICRAAALAIRTEAMELGKVAGEPPAPPKPPEESEPYQFSFFTTAAGYHTAMELRVARGAWGTGALTGWMRMRVPLLPDEAPSGLQRVLAAADSGNGLSVALDLTRFTFLNPDLTVYLQRPPEGEWIGLDAVTRVEPIGIGLAESALFDRRGVIGRSLQSLIVEKRDR